MKQKFAVFDLDGTLIRWQLFHTVVEQLVEQGSIDSQAYVVVTQLLESWRKRTHANAFSLYEKAVLDAWYGVLTDITHQEYLTAIETVFERHKDQVYRYTRDLIAELRQKQYYLIAISGSHREIVEKIAAYYEFDYAVGSVYTMKNGKFTGEIDEPVHNKGRALREIVHRQNLSWRDSYAIGDSRSDAKMMELVEHPIAFNPNQDLITIARENTWPIVIERKNVIYKLSKQNNVYTLAE